MLITVGPIVGFVYHDVARILVELDSNATLACVVREAGKEDVFVTVSGIKCQANKPRGFTIKNLKSATSYTITFRCEADDEDKTVKKIDNASDRTASFQTFPLFVTLSNVQESTTLVDDKKSDIVIPVSRAGFWSLRFALASTNKSSDITKFDLWQIIKERVLENKMKKLDFVLHLGGQIVGDESFTKALEIVGSGDITQEVEDKVTELFRAQYRKEWNQASLRYILAHTSNLMVLGHQDMSSSFGTQASHLDTSTKESKVAQLARKVYWEYQRQLWEDVDSTKAVSTTESHCVALDTVGVLFLDQVTGHSFIKDADKPYLSKTQWTELSSHFSSNGKLSKITTLIIVSSAPIGFAASTSSDVTKKLQELGSPARDDWAHGAHQDEQKEFIKLVQQWAGVNPQREVFVASGNTMGFGCHTQINFGDKKLMYQIVTSPVTANLPSWVKPEVLQGFGQAQDAGDSIKMSSTDFCAELNFGIIDVTMETGKKPLVETYLIRPSLAKPNQNKSIANSTGKEDSCCTVS